VGAEIDVVTGGWHPIPTVVGCNPVPGGFGIWQAWEPFVGWGQVPHAAGVSISAVVGNPSEQGVWLTNNVFQIWDEWLLATQFSRDPGCAQDIELTPFGLSNSVWVIGCNPVPGGFDIYQQPLNGGSWVRVPGGAVRIGVDPGNNAWVTNDAGQIYHWNGNVWVHVPGCGYDIDVGADGSVWVVGCNPVPGGYGIYRLTSSGWLQEPGGAVSIGVDPTGNHPWVTNNIGQIFSS
jgi:hypothetical protein